MRVIALSVLVSLIGALLPTKVEGQCASTQERPQWVEGYFMEKPKSYVEVVSASGYDEENARNKAALEIVKRRSLIGQNVRVTTQGGTIQVEGSNSLEVKSRIIDEYREYCGPGIYRVNLLVQTVKNPTYDPEDIFVSTSYPLSYRAFVPGMAQLHKGSTTKGIMFITGQIALVSGVVITENLRASYNSKINSTHNAAQRQDYIDQANMMGNVRNGLIAGAVALYAWNVIDGVVAKGKKQVFFGSAGLRVAPYATMQSSGMVLSLNF